MRFDIEGYVDSKLTRAKPVASGGGGKEYTAECPSCCKWGKFYINVETGKFLCNSCRFSGRSVVPLVAHVEEISYGHALKWIFTQSVELPRKGDMMSLRERIAALRNGDGDETGGAELVDFPLPSGFRPCFVDGRWSLPAYLKERRIKSATAAAWGLGYCDKIQLGEKIMKGRRLVIPIECPAGRSWTARAMSPDVFGPKYLNPDGADHRRLLIGWNTLRFGGELLVCEGPLDAVKLWQHDLPAVALGGKVLHDEQLAQLATLPSGTAVTVMLDPEELVAPHDVAVRLSTHFKQIYLARLPEGVDPGDSTSEIAQDAVESAERWGLRRTGRLKDLLKSSRRRVGTRHAS